MSIAKIIIEGTPKGTAWLIHEEHVVTAAHCVGTIGSKAMVYLLDPATKDFDKGVEATVVESDLLMDAALLKLDTPRPDLSPLSVTEYGPAHNNPNWNAEGFPAAAEDLVSSFGFSGSVQLMHTTLQREGMNADVIQLACTQGTERLHSQNMVDGEGFPIHTLAGVSGAAIRIPERGGRVVAIVRCAMTPLGANVIYACPIKAIWAKFAPHLLGVILHTWHRTAGVVRNGPIVGTIISTIDVDLVAAAWKEDVVKDITIDLPWDKACPLIPAILRIILHQSGIVRLHVRNAAAWNLRLVRYANDWIALAPFSPDEIVKPAIELALASHDAGNSFPTAAAAAEAIHAACDQFVLDYLNERLTAMFEAPHPRDYANFDIAADVLELMSSTWANWQESLCADPALLHHFLALMLTHQGGHDCIAEASPGAGPLTMEKCILPATIFGLAIAPFLPNALVPKRPQPGNIGHDQTTAHSCGILAVKRQRLESALSSHPWATPVVLLQHLQYLPEQWRAATSNLLSSGHSPRPTLSRLAPSSLVITSDMETLEAIGMGAQAIRDHLANLCASQAQIKEDYVTSASPQT